MKAACQLKTTLTLVMVRFTTSSITASQSTVWCGSSNMVLICWLDLDALTTLEMIGVAACCFVAWSVTHSHDGLRNFNFLSWTQTPTRNHNIAFVHLDNAADASVSVIPPLHPRLKCDLRNEHKNKTSTAIATPLPRHSWRISQQQA